MQEEKRLFCRRLVSGWQHRQHASPSLLSYWIALVTKYYSPSHKHRCHGPWDNLQKSSIRCIRYQNTVMENWNTSVRCQSKAGQAATDIFGLSTRCSMRIHTSLAMDASRLEDSGGVYFVIRPTRLSLMKTFSAQDSPFVTLFVTLFVTEVRIIRCAFTANWLAQTGIFDWPLEARPLGQTITNILSNLFRLSTMETTHHSMACLSEQANRIVTCASLERLWLQRPLLTRTGASTSWHSWFLTIKNSQRLLWNTDESESSMISTKFWFTIGSWVRRLKVQRPFVWISLC